MARYKDIIIGMESIQDSYEITKSCNMVISFSNDALSDFISHIDRLIDPVYFEWNDITI